MLNIKINKLLSYNQIYIKIWNFKFWDCYKFYNWLLLSLD